MSDWADLLKRHIDDPKTDARIRKYFNNRPPISADEVREAMTIKAPTEEQIAYMLKEIESILEKKE